MSDKKNLDVIKLDQKDKVSEDPVTKAETSPLLQKINHSFFGSIVAARSARATEQVTVRACSSALLPLRPLELRSIYALFAWVANEQHAAPETVRCMTEVRFGIADVTELRQKDYDDVIKFLVDLRLDELKN
jgi:hypothetical protein